MQKENYLVIKNCALFLKHIYESYSFFVNNKCIFLAAGGAGHGVDVLYVEWLKHCQAFHIFNRVAF